MTTLHVVDDVPLADAVAARLRGVMAELRMSQTRFQELTGWTRGVVQQRYSGKVPLDVADLELIEKRTGIQIDYLIREEGPKHRPPGGGGGAPNAPNAPIPDDLSPLTGLNRRPLAYLVPRRPALIPVPDIDEDEAA